jgi:hypothetical protein
MTKTELLADLATKCGGVILATDLVETVGSVKRYISNVFTAGEDMNAGPIAQKRNISWYVYDEGGAGEAAYYSERNFYNPESRNPTGSSFISVHGIFTNPELRQRVTGTMVNAVRLVMAEDPGSDARRLVAKETMINQACMLDAFMIYVASNGTIQFNGGAASDSDLDYVVRTEAWDKIATALALG